MILVLVLVALLAGLVLSLSVLGRIEVRVMETSMAQASARQNALMALRVALGQLQKFAGPDTRVTATAEAFGGVPGSRHYTGVWATDHSGLEPLTWLVSGNEVDPVTIKPMAPGPSVELVGATTSGVAGDVIAPLRPILAATGPEPAGSAVIGHFAWWVGDEGVKATVAQAPETAAITYTPFDVVENRNRLRQQAPFGAGPSDSLGNPVFEPRDLGADGLVGRITSFEQLSLLPPSPGSAPLGMGAVRPFFHDWTVDHQAVLADSRRGGLRHDLSLAPELLGDAFAAWVQPSSYMEDPAKPLAPAIVPAYPPAARESLRRRYRLTAPRVASGIVHEVTPVLSYFLLTFNVRTNPSASGAQRPLEVRARWLVSLWNPYSSALVPEDLQLEVAGLPALSVANDSDGTALPAFGLDELYGAPLRISLPWVADGREDRQSWLPGRVHTWASKEDLNKGSPATESGFASVFYTRTLSTAAGQGVQRAVPGLTIANSAQAHLVGDQAQLTVVLYRSTPDGGRERLRTFLSPTFSAFSTTPTAINAATYQFTYVFHLAESTDTPGSPDLWLTTPGRDPRESTLPATAYLPGPNGPRPELYANYTSISFPDRLLDRALPASASSATGQSYNEDVPVFELPRGPVLTVGALQHLAIAGMRPFAIGNSWGSATGWNALFDRYFLSGLTPEVAAAIPRAGSTLPNALLHLIPRRADGTKPTVDDLVAETATGFSSRHLLQSGAFNINSVRPAAWLAVLRSGRRLDREEFSFVDASPSSGTGSGSATQSSAPGETMFYRFSASAQETYKADAGYAASTTIAPTAPNPASPAATHLYRRGVRILSHEQTVALAGALAEAVMARQASSGPYGSLEEFLAPDAQVGGRNLLEQAIQNAGASEGRAINDPAAIAEFSSQWLTAGDLMTALAPILSARSDTFRIRSYGDTVNPATGEVSARAWAEAMVQRVPSYVDESQAATIPPAELNATNRSYGRRFRIVSFRWLDASNL